MNKSVFIVLQVFLFSSLSYAGLTLGRPLGFREAFKSVGKVVQSPPSFSSLSQNLFALPFLSKIASVIREGVVKTEDIENEAARRQGEFSLLKHEKTSEDLVKERQERIKELRQKIEETRYSLRKTKECESIEEMQLELGELLENPVVGFGIFLKDEDWQRFDNVVGSVDRQSVAVAIDSKWMKSAPSSKEDKDKKSTLSGQNDSGDSKEVSLSETSAVVVQPDASTGQETRRTAKREREEEEGIPFQGPTDRNFWTGGIPPNTAFELRTLDPNQARERLPEGRNWAFYEMGDQMSLRPAGNMTIPQWARMGFWTKNQFGLLFALSARVPDFSVVSFWSDTTSEMALVVQKEDQVFVEVAQGPSKTKAKQIVAEKMVRAGDVWKWIDTKYHETEADKHLQGPVQSAASSQAASTLFAETTASRDPKRSDSIDALSRLFRRPGPRPWSLLEYDNGQ